MAHNAFETCKVVTDDPVMASTSKHTLCVRLLEVVAKVSEVTDNFSGLAACT
jgi:hypothetical protein